MKKFYTLFLSLVVAVTCFGAAAKTFKVKLTNTSQVLLINPSTSGPVSEFDADNSFSFDTANFDEHTSAIFLSAVSGNEIVSVLDENGTSVVNSHTTFPNDGCSIELDLVNDGSTITVTSREKEKIYLTVLGDPEQIRVQYNYGDVPYADGQWKIEHSYQYATLNIYANDGFGIESVVDETGTPQYASTNSASIYCGSFNTNKTFTVKTYDVEATRTASFTVKVDGNPADVVLTRSSDYAQISLTDESQVIKFNPSTETSFSLRHSNYSKQLYYADINGIAVQSSGGTFYINVKDGDIVTVNPDFPEIYVPMTFTFTNENTEGILREVRLDGVLTDAWKEEDFTVKLGTQVALSFDQQSYSDLSITLNGSPVSQYGYSFTVQDETPLNFVFTGTPIPPRHITVITNLPEGVKLVGNGSFTSTYELTGEENEIEVPVSVSYLAVTPQDGYVIEAVEHNNSSLSSWSYITVQDGDELVIIAGELIRDQTFTLYVQDTSWASRTLVLSPYNYDIRKAYETADVPVGYSTFNFGSFDLPIQVTSFKPDYSEPYVYVNGDAVSTQYSNAYLNLNDGDVLKIYGTEPASYNVTYDISEDVDVEVRHDIHSTIDAPSTHPVLEGTAVHIRPAAGLLRAETSKIAVTVNDQQLTPDEDGVFATTINDHTTIKVKAATITGVESIDAIQADENTPVYNLQGMRVGTVKGAASLPQGIYIINGQKVRK